MSAEGGGDYKAKAEDVWKFPKLSPELSILASVSVSADESFWGMMVMGY